MNKLLIVDDEKSIQRSIKRSFFDFPYEIYTASEAEEALSMVNEIDIDLIVSDFKMPGMDGVDFLNIVKNKFPSIIRILISGYIDKDKLMDALFQFNVTSLIPKPWNDETLHETVKKYIDLKNEINDKSLWNKLNSHNLVSMFIDDTQEIGKLLEYILRRPHIFCGLLHLYNSEYYNGKTETDIQEIVKHFTPESIESLISRSLIQKDKSLLNLRMNNNPGKILDLYAKMGIDTQVNCLNKNFINPSMINLYRYILSICDREFYNTLSEGHFFLKKSETGVYSFHDSVKKIFLNSSYFLRLWNVADNYLMFSNKFIMERAVEFGNMDNCPKVLFILDYYLEEYCDETLDYIIENISKDSLLQQLLKLQ